MEGREAGGFYTEVAEEKPPSPRLWRVKTERSSFAEASKDMTEPFHRRSVSYGGHAA
jgi:hypothetical protein